MLVVLVETGQVRSGWRADTILGSVVGLNKIPACSGIGDVCEIRAARLQHAQRQGIRKCGTGCIVEPYHPGGGSAGPTAGGEDGRHDDPAAGAAGLVDDIPGIDIDRVRADRSAAAVEFDQCRLVDPHQQGGVIDIEVLDDPDIVEPPAVAGVRGGSFESKTNPDVGVAGIAADVEGLFAPSH